MRHTGGWIKLHRKVLKNEVLDDAPALAIWALLLMWANRKDGSSRLKGQLVTVKRGQVATSTRDIARKLKLHKNLVARRLTDLEKSEMVTQHPTQHGTLITIVNYDAYQLKSAATGQLAGHTRTTREPHAGHTRPDSGEERELSYGEKKQEQEPPPRAHARNDRSGEGFDVEALRLRATSILNRAAGALRRELGAGEAREYVGAEGWKAIMVRYPGWDDFCRAYRNTYEKATPSIAEGQFRDAIAAALIDSRQAGASANDELGRDLNC